NKDITFEDIYHAVNQKDPLCSQIIKKAASITGVGISNISNLILPELIILSGPTYTKMDLFYKTDIQSFYNLFNDGSSYHKIHFKFNTSRTNHIKWENIHKNEFIL